ncbi:MAG: hypothetical protein AB8C84_03515 [Oligoflexales bacterium]
MLKYFLYFICFSSWLVSSCKNQSSEQGSQPFVDKASNVEKSSGEVEGQPKENLSSGSYDEKAMVRPLPPEGTAPYTVSSLSIEWGQGPGQESYIHTEWERGDYLAYHLCPQEEVTDESLCLSGKSFHRSFAIGLIPEGTLFVQAWICSEDSQGHSTCGPVLSKSFQAPNLGQTTKKDLFYKKQVLMTRLHSFGLSLKELLAELQIYEEHCEYSVEQKQIFSELLALPSGVLAESAAKEHLESINSSQLQLHSFTKVDVKNKNNGMKETSKLEASRVNSHINSKDKMLQDEAPNKSDVTRWSKLKKWIKAHKEESILLLGGLSVSVALLKLTTQKEEPLVSERNSGVSSVCGRTSGLFLQVNSLLTALKGLSAELEWTQTQIDQ